MIRRRKVHRNPFIFGVFCLGLLIILSACNKDLADDELGQVISYSEIQDKYLTILEKIDNKMETGDWVFLHQKGSISGVDSNTSESFQIELTNTEEANCYNDVIGKKANYVEIRQKKINGKLEQHYWESDFCVRNDLYELLYSFYYSTYSADATYHNLSLTNEIGMPPQAVVDDSCPGIPDCKIRIFNLDFDQVFLLNGKQTRIHYSFQISPDVPFLARDLKVCKTISYPVDNNIVPVTQCNEVRNFGKNSDT